MTKNWELELHNGVYCEKLQQEDKGTLRDFYKKTLCVEFVNLVVGGDPEKIGVILNDRGGNQEGFIEVRVVKNGHYRWWFSFGDKVLSARSNKFGLYRAGEEILMNMFPNKFDEKEKDGKWKAVVFLKDDGTVGVEEYSLWIKVTSL